MKTNVKELKIPSEDFNALVFGEKTFEILKNEEGINVGDVLILREYDGYYTGSAAVVRIAYALNEFEGLVEGYSVLSMELLWNGI